METNDVNVNRSDDTNPVSKTTESEVQKSAHPADEETADKKAEQTKRVKKKKKRPSLTLILTIASIVLFFLTSFVIRTGIRNGGKTLANTFSDNYNSEHDNTYTKITEFWKKKVEEANKVTNNQAISIAEIREKADLEVLMISDTTETVRPVREYWKKPERRSQKMKRILRSGLLSEDTILKFTAVRAAEKKFTFRSLTISKRKINTVRQFRQRLCH